MDEGPSEPDILEHGGGPGRPRLPWPGRRLPWGASVTAAVALVLGLAAGYAVGHAQGRGPVAAPGKSAAPARQAPGGSSATIVATAPSAPIDFAGPALTENPGTCSVQVGRDLELGIPVTNLSGETVLLKSVKPAPLTSGMLKVLSWRWGPCGFDDNGIVPDTVVLGPGETTWVTAVVQPLIACPSPAPLQFRVAYSVNRQESTFNLPGFADLSAVRYSGCPASRR
ncbi:MAG TPA: hypothetical protein VF223_12385 [Trebonia sp.]